MDRAKPVIALLGLVLLAGCGSVYKKDSTCPGYLEGEHCQDLRETYEATHEWDRDRYRARLRGQAAEAADQAPIQAQRVGHYAPYMVADEQPRPILTQAVPVRIYIDPYEDRAGRLHTPGHVYVRATEPQWIFGQEKSSGSRVVTPLVTDR